MIFVLFLAVKVLLVYWLCVTLYLKALSELKLHRKSKIMDEASIL